MTTLVAVRKNDEIAIAADSLTTFGDTRLAAEHDRTSDKIVHYRGTYIGLCGSAAHQLVFESLLAAARRPRFLEQGRDLRDVPQAASDPEGAALPEPEGRGGRPVRVDADHGADRERARHLRRVLDARGVRVHAFWAVGSGREFALGAMHALYPQARDRGRDRPRGHRGRRDRSTGIPALPMTLYTVSLKTLA